MRELALRLHATVAMAVRRGSDAPLRGRVAAGEERLPAQPTGVTTPRVGSVVSRRKHDSKAAAKMTAAPLRYLLLHSWQVHSARVARGQLSKMNSLRADTVELPACRRQRRAGGWVLFDSATVQVLPTLSSGC